MLVRKTSMLTGNQNEMDLPVTEEGLKHWRRGALIQDVFPNLTPDQREFLITGSTPGEWEAAFGDEE